MPRVVFGLLILIPLVVWGWPQRTGMPTGPSFTNSLGMNFVRIEPQKFRMGESHAPVPDELIRPLSYPQREELEQRFPQGDPDKFVIDVSHVRDGDFDERPVREVIITQPFYMAATEVTNAQYERFDPSHRALRGKNGFSHEDDEAVVFVNWHEAKGYCAWLSAKEGRPYRLPTEAEWELACRAGTTTPFHTGSQLPETFHKNQRRTSFKDRQQDRVSLRVAQTPPSPWGLFDMHGNVEEWTEDWYGPYGAADRVDPVGRAYGDFKVTRGGSHGTEVYYLRSANRSGTLPENRTWLIGFRVVLAEPPTGKPLPPVEPERHQLDVSQAVPDISTRPDPNEPYFKGPRDYVRIPPGSGGPLYAHHNHDPGIVALPNGDLLAIWYTCMEERGRELAVAASRLRHGADEWEPASLFWDAPDRNDHCPALWHDGRQTLYHFNGLSTAGMWEPLAVVMRTSTDNGATWSPGRLIEPEHGYRQMVGEPVFRAQDGAMVFGADAGGGSTVWISRDHGRTWSDPGGTIAGIHAGITQLLDGRLMALGRGMNIDGRMPVSLSSDMGRSWTAEASIFPPLSGGQRPVLRRLNEGPLFFASFAHDADTLEIRNRAVTGIFAAVSFDEGKTWPVRRIITAGESDRAVRTIDGAPVLMNRGRSEPQGYLAAKQSADGVIHLISSQQHYAFNLAWLKAPAPESDPTPTGQGLPTRSRLSEVHEPDAPLPPSERRWQFVGTPPGAGPDLPGRTIHSRDGHAPRWSNERLNGFTPDVRRGFTTEIALEVKASDADDDGVDFEVFARTGPLTVNQYRITVSRAAVHYRYDGKLEPLAEELDNSGRHVYRIAVRPDTAVQIYRDGTLLGVRAADLRIDWRAPARGHYIEFGAGSTGVLANVGHVAYDLSGPYAPQP